MKITHTNFGTIYAEGRIIMGKTEHLAIASVPIQQWNHVYDEDRAFRNGTMFPELHRPFYVTVLDDKELTSEQHLTGEQAMLLKIQKIGFMLDDLRLYLDTHPQDKEALKMFKENLAKKTSLMREFALQYYPLAEVCMGVIYKENPESECYCWPEGKIPWEGACS